VPQARVARGAIRGEAARLGIVGPHNMKSIEVELYRPGDGRTSYQMQVDGEYGCNWLSWCGCTP
jgi:hypothetical protein